jgi:hypothetical protein
VVGDGNHSLIDLLIEEFHLTGGAETRCMERIEEEAPPPFISGILLYYCP